MIEAGIFGSLHHDKVTVSTTRGDFEFIFANIEDISDANATMKQT